MEAETMPIQDYDTGYYFHLWKWESHDRIIRIGNQKGRRKGEASMDGKILNFDDEKIRQLMAIYLDNEGFDPYTPA